MGDRQRPGPRWRTSSTSGAGNCVEAAIDADRVLVRDSKAPDGAVLSFTPDAWMAFVRGLDDIHRPD